MKKGKIINKKITKNLFIYPAINNESLGIEYISAALKKSGHETDLILHYENELFFEKRLIKKIKDFNPDFVCFSVVTTDYLWALEVSKFIKKCFENIQIIFGGIQPTSCPEEVISNKCVDYIIMGEGDEAIVELVENPDKTNILNVWTKKNRNTLRPLLVNLDNLSFPDKDLFYKEAPYLMDTYICTTGKGCPFSCSYCFNNCLKKMYAGNKWVRRRSVRNVIEELKWAKKKFKYKRISFMDDCFIMNGEWIKEFTRIYKKEIGVPFRAISHPAFLNKEIVTLLKDAGCIKMQIGAQTPSDKIRKEICKRHDTNKIIYKAVKILKKAKIIVSVDHIFGLPSEEIEDYETRGGDRKSVV